jgi:hypothetical protein
MGPDLPRVRSTETVTVPAVSSTLKLLAAKSSCPGPRSDSGVPWPKTVVVV